MIQPTYSQMPGQGGANAVAINIYNPQAYGAQPNQMANQNMTMPYNYTNSLYQMPMAQTYAMPETQVYTPQPQMVQQGFFQPATPLIQPAPQVMPESVMNTAQMEPMAAQAPVVNNEVQQAVMPTVETTQENIPTIDTDMLVNNLKSNDTNKIQEAINQIATYVQDKPEIALQVVSEPIMNALVEVINKDTTALEGPSEAQVAVAQKIDAGETLTAEEEALAEQLSPRDKANKNRIFALFTIAMIQKLQRDELEQYIATQKANGVNEEEIILSPSVSELTGFNDIVNIIKNDSRPEVKTAAIQALQHVTTPEDLNENIALTTEQQNIATNNQEFANRLDANTQLKQQTAKEIKDVLTTCANSEFEDIKQAASEAMTTLGLV